MKIRDAAPNERARIREMRVEAYREHAAAIPEDHWQALRRGLSSEADALPEVELIVGEIEGRIVGSVALFPPDSDAYEGMTGAVDYPEIRMLAVSPDSRGAGAASALIAECIRRARGKGYRAIGLHTGDFMTGARRLYEKIGFERVPEHDFQPADDGIVVMAFRLSI